MHELELVFGLFVVVVAAATIAVRVSIPDPIVMVAGGLIVGLIPAIPDIQLNPDTVFLLLLPPALFSAAVGTDWRGFRRDSRAILLLAVNLVLTTMVGVAVVAVAVINDVPWNVAFVLGAIVSPPDAVATLAIVRKLGIPQRLVTVLEGESLINDATALVAYRFAVAAVVTGTFSIWDAGFKFIYVALGGIVLGLGVGAIMLVFLSRVIQHSTLGNAAALLTPIAAYLPAEELGFSGVLAVVAAGLLFSRKFSDVVPAPARLQAGIIWGFLTFLIDGFVFVLIGLQLPTVIDGLDRWSAWELLWYATAVSAAAIAIRVIAIWIGMLPILPRPMMRFDDPELAWKAPAVVGWAGPRGVVTLATALALPLTIDGGQGFPYRDLVIFLSYCMILVTLVGQGLTLPLLIRRLKFPEDNSAEIELAFAIREATTAAIERLDDPSLNAWAPKRSVSLLKATLNDRLARMTDDEEETPTTNPDLAVQRRLRDDIVRTQRTAARKLHERGEISDQTLRKVEQELDVIEIRDVR